MNRTKNTLFLLSSIDGKISLSDKDTLDYDKDLPRIPSIYQGLHQYYELEQRTDLYSLNSGRVLVKVGINNEFNTIEKLPVSFIVIDNKPHLSKKGVENLLQKSNTLFIITTNKEHPAFAYKVSHLNILYYEGTIDFKNLFERLYSEFSIENITIQSGGGLNSVFLKNGLIDKLSLVVAPILVGGDTTPSIIGGKSIQSIEEISKIGLLKLDTIDILEDSYIHLHYSVNNTNESKI